MPKSTLPGALAGIDSVKLFDASYADCLTDESRMKGWAESISFPTSSKQVSLIVKACADEEIPLVCQGSRTGITGAAVPLGGHVMGLSKMNQVHGIAITEVGVLLTVGPGMTLGELNHLLEGDFDSLQVVSHDNFAELAQVRQGPRLFWPPDPSEEQASIGGIASNNAAGISRYRYGHAARYIQGLEWVDGNGEEWQITRGKYLITEDGEGGYRCPTPMGKTLEFTQIDNRIHQSRDLVDLLLGGEGMLGVITALTLLLKPAPVHKWCVIAFFDDWQQSATFIDSFKERDRGSELSLAPSPLAAVEFFDSSMLDVLKQARSHVSALQRLPPLPSSGSVNSKQAAVYIEMHHDSVDRLETYCEELLMALLEFGVEEEAMWAAMDNSEFRRLRQLRLLAPEITNMALVSKAKGTQTKLATDLAISASFEETLQHYKRQLVGSGVPYTLFGHALDNHLHLNFLPETDNQLKIAQGILQRLLSLPPQDQSHLCVEHGIGKLKAEYLMPALPQSEYQMQQLKAIFDPQHIFNPYNWVMSSETRQVEIEQ